MLRDVGKLFSSPRVMPDLIRHLLVAALFFSAAFSMSGCSGEVSVDQKFVNLFVELRVAEMTYGKDSPMGRLVRQDALKAAGYTREQFLAKTDEILNDERQWVPFQKAVNARIDSLLAIPSETNAAADTKNAPRNPVPKMVNVPKREQPQMPAHKGGVH
jgi:hypothetical protein